MEYTERLENQIRREALELARDYSLEQLALMVAEHAPDKRGKWSLRAQIPWRLIIAIRMRAADL